MKAKKMTLELKKLTSAIKVWQLACAGLLASQIAAPAAYAAPKGGIVVGGEGTIDTKDLTTIIDQQTDLLAIDWDSFNLSEEELVKFLQPDSSSIVLNRILDQSPSDIRGAIEANGHVILANPRGVLFTETATVNVRAITASGLDMDPAEFMNGNFAFRGEDGSSGVVVNRGVINASSTVLVGKQVTNASSGLISAEMVSLAAADEAVLTFDADGMIGVKITKEVMENQLGVDSAVLNEGHIDGTQVLMEASVSGDLFTSAVNNEGTVRARGIDTSGGSIRLTGSGGAVANSGTLDASGSTGGRVAIDGDSATHSGQIVARGDKGLGGRVELLGDHVTVSGDIDARGRAGGGEVLIGGDYQGKNEQVRNAETTVVTAEADIDASGIGNSDGGKVIVWADDSTDFAGSIRAESGALGGDGGFVETSGKVNLRLGEDTMFVSTLSLSGGETGEWLLDPGWLDISDSCSANCISVTSLQTALDSNNVTIAVTDADTADGGGLPINDDGDPGTDYADGIRVSSNLSWSAATTLTLDSFSDIRIENGVTISAASGDLSMIAGGSFTSDGSVNVNNFSLSVGDSGADTTNTLGTVTVAGSGSITGGAGLDSFTLTSADDVLVVDGDKSFTLSGNISFDAVDEVDAGGGNDTVTAIEVVTLTGSSGEASTSGTLFSGIEAINGGSLEGSDSADTFVITGTNAVTANDIAFSGISDVDAKLGNDSVTGADGADWALNGADNEAQNSGITFSNVETLSAVNAGLIGTAGDDSFVLNADGRVGAYGMAFDGLNAVDGASGTNTLDASAYAAGVALNGTDNQLNAAAIVFSNIHSAVASALAGSAGADTFTVTSTNSLDAAGISFSGVTDINAGQGDDTVTAIDVVTLTGNSGEASTSGILFTGIEAASGGSLVASDNADTFVVTGSNAVTANDIAFSGISDVDAKLGNDSVTGTDGVDWVLSGTDHEAQNSGITFSNVEVLSAVNAGLIGTAGDDSFVLNADGSVGSYGMAFDGLNAVDGASGTNSLNASAYAAGVALTGSDNQLSAASITFSNIQSAVASALAGSSGADTFTVTSINSLDAAGISFTGVSDVNAGLGDDTVTAINVVTLTGIGGEASTSGIAFAGIETVTGGSLEGSDSADTFSVTGLNAVTANDIAFSGISSIDAKLGSDSVTGTDGVDWTLTGTNNQAENNGITFSSVETLTADNAGLIGTAGDDSFVLQVGGDVGIYGMFFSGLDSVDGAGGSNNSLDASAYTAGVALTGSDNQLSAASITFSNIQSAVASALAGSSGADTFTIISANSLDAAGISFSGLNSVDGLGGNNSLDASGYLTGVALTGTDNQLSAGSITFSNIQGATALALAGSSGADSFTVTGANSLDAAGINFSGVTSVDADLGGDTVGALSVVTLTGNSGEASTNGIVFTGIETVTGGSLEGSDSADTFSVTGLNAVTANDIAFSGISSIDAKLGSDSVTGTDGVDWTLTGTSNQAENNGVTFSNVETLAADNAGLIGTAGDDSFVLQAGGNVGIYGMTFSGLDSVDGAGGTNNSLDASAYAAGLALTGNSNQLNAGSITFSNIQSAVAAALAGSSGADSFAITGANSLDAAGISFSGLSTVDAGLESDTVGALAMVTLTGNSGEASTSGIVFAGIETVTGGSLEGSDSADTFSVTGLNAVTANDIAFSGISSIDAKLGSDSITGADGVDWTLTGTNNQAENNGVTFSNVETLAADNAGLIGTAGDDSFVLQAGGNVGIYGMTFSGLGSVDGAGGTNNSLDASAYTAGVALTGSDNQLNNGSITFSNIQSAMASVLAGSSGADTFTITAANSLHAAGITFSGVSSVNAGLGSDTVTAIDVVALTGNSSEASTSGILFTGIEAASGGSLEASDNADTFVVTGANALTANDIAFSGINSVDAKLGNDSVTGADDVDWTLTGASNQAVSSGITFSNVEALAAVNAGLIGTAGDDSFVLQASGNVDTYGMTFSGLTFVDGLTGINTLDASTYLSGLTLTGNSKEFSAGSLLFSGINEVSTVNLYGTSFADTFTVTGDNRLTVNDISFSGLEYVNARSDAGGKDTLYALEDLGNGGGSRFTSGIEFVNFEKYHVATGVVRLVAGETEISVMADGSVVTNLSEYADAIIVYGTSETETATGLNGENWILIGLNQAENYGITFHDIDTLVADGAGLLGTSGDDSFTLSSSGDVSFGSMTIQGANFVNGLDGIDYLDASALLEALVLTGSDYQINASGLVFSNIESVVASALSGTNSPEVFTITSSNSLDVAGISFSGLSTLNSAGGGDTVNIISDVYLAESGAGFTSSGIEFSGIQSATASASVGLFGSLSDESFSLVSDNVLDAIGIRFSNISSVDGGDGSDSIAALGPVTLTGANEEAISSGISFSDIESVTGGSLVASDLADSFVVTGSDSITANDIAFSGITGTIDAMLGNDSVTGLDGADWTLTGTDYQAVNNGITFSNVEALVAVNAGLVGTAGDDSFVLQAGGGVGIHSMTFSGLDSVDGLAGSNSLDASAYGAGVALTGTDNQLSAGSITFSNIQSAVAAALAGSSGADLFTITAANSLDAAGISFSGLSSVNADTGLDTVAATGVVALTGSAGEAKTSGIDFSGIEAVIGGSLAASDNADTFVITGANAVTANEIAFSGISSVDAKLGNDSVTGADGADWSLTATNNEATNNGITFFNVESLTAINGGLIGTAGDDSFVLQTGGQVGIHGMTFSGLDSVDGLAGSNSLDASAYWAGVALTGTNNQLTAGSIIFSNFQSAVTAALAGSSGADLFTITAANSLDAAGISFSGLSNVNAGTGSDTVAVAAMSVVQLTGGNGEAGTSGIDFTGIEAVTGGSLEASDNADTFVITGTNAVTANEIAFSGISSVDARGGIDSVTGADGTNWTLTGVDYEATNNGITFSNVEALSAVSGGLIGTAGNDSFVLQAGGGVDIYGMTFSDLDSVDGLAGSNSLDASAYAAGVALTGSNNQLSAGSITFSNIQSAVASALAGSSGADLFTITAANSLNAAGISFSGLDSVSGGTGSDTVSALGVVTLTGNSREAQTSGIDFTGIEAVTGGSLEGSDAADSFAVTGANALIANEIAFSAISSVDARGGNDTVAGFAGADWTALGNTTARNSGITFSSVELLSASSAGLIGSSGNDSFTLQADGSVGLLGMTFLDLNAVDALDGADSLDASTFDAGLALTGTAKQLAAGGLLFSNFEDVVTAALAGTSGADTFSITGTGALSAAGMDFSGVTSIDAGAGSDIVSSSVSDAWTLTANSDEAEHAGITFSAAESFSGGSGVLSGHASGDNYTVAAAGTVSVDNMTFSDLSDISGGSGTDALQAVAAATLSGADGAFSTSGMSFSGFDLLTAADLVATGGDDGFQMLADSTLGIYGLTISGVDSLDAGGGNDSVMGRSGLGYQLNGDASVTHDGIAFTGLEDFVGQNATLVATSGAEGFTMTAADALDIDSTNLSFSGLVAVDAGGGADVLAALGSVALNGAQAVTAGSIAITNIDRVTGTGALTGTGAADQFSVVASNQLDSYGIRFEGVDSVAAAGGSDNLVGLDTESWQLSGSDNALNHAGIDFTGLESTSGGNGVLTGSTSADQFTITASNQVTANSITFTAINQVDAGAGADSVNSAAGETWVLGAVEGSAVAVGIDFSNIETVGGNDVVVDAATNNASDSFVLSDSGQALSVRGIDFSSAGRVMAGADAGDSVTSDAGDWQLTGTDGELSVNGVELSGIDRVITANALLRGTANSETFALAGEGALGVAGMAFEGIARVAAGGGSDLLQGTAAADQFELADSGDISVAAISFSGIETVAAGEGADTVNSSGASWTSVRSGNALVDGSARAEVNSMTVLFQDLELVNSAGSYAGQDIDTEYVFSSLDTLAVAGVTFAGLDSFAGGSGFDVLHGADIDAQWTLDTAQGSIRSGGQSLVFSGVESIVAGSGADQFTLSGGELTAIDTGAGNDRVLLAGTSLETLSLGEGNDLLQVDADSSQGVLLSGGGGDDEFQFNVADKTWQITGGNNQVGSFQFTGFEWLDNNTGSLSLETDRSFDFVNGGDNSAAFNRNGAGILFADSGMRLGYDGSGDININSTATGTIGGELQADRAELVVAGDVDIVTDVNVLDIHTSGEDIDISILAKKDLVIDEINAGRGNISIDSAGFGSLTADTYGDTHLTAGTVRLGSELQQWTSIGSAINPLRMNVSQSVDLVSISYFEPDFIGQIPAFSATGDELQSVAGAQAAQGLKSAVQNAVEDFAQVDPGIFSAVNPYSTGVDAVNTPEMRLSGEELVPMVNSTTPDDEERLPGRSAELEEGEDSAEEEHKRAALAPAGVGG